MISFKQKILKRTVLAASLIYPLAAFAQNYFQQDVKYTIHVKLDDVKHEYTADETIGYTNNSPDELPFLWFHIWPNAYRNNNTALAKDFLLQGKKSFYFASDNDRGYIDQLDFRVNGEPIKWEYDKENIDICKLILNKPLKPGETISVSTPFHVKVPKGVFSRMGHLGQAYQITQWYPKPAVYDRSGWNQFPYLDQGEFYSEYGTYDVFITLPKNYVVGSTGDLVNGEEESKWMNEKVKETEEKKYFDPKDTTFPVSSTEWKTLHYHQEKVHDFGWFADKRWNVLKSQVELPYSKRKVTTWTMFLNENAEAWRRSTEYVNDAVYFYSKWNGEYPYNHATAVDGALSAGSGMEYPNVTVIGSENNPLRLEVVIVHEVGHNWFYGILGSNERVHAWMDEGINSFNEYRYVQTKYPGVKLARYILGDRPVKLFGLQNVPYKAFYELSYFINAARGMDQPMELHSHDFTTLNYGGIVYSKTALVFNYLKAYLGEEEFDKCMHKYFDTWKFRHPMPEDIRKIFEETTGKNLSWFFDDVIKTNKKIDYKICSVRKSKCANSFTGDCWEVTLKNKGDIASPVCINPVRNGQAGDPVWFEGFKGKQKVNIYTIEFDKLHIDGKEVIPEMNRHNNIIRKGGLFRKTEPLKVQFLGGFDNPERTQLFFTPVIGWNEYNRWMPGITLYNHFIPEKKFEWTFMPLFGTGNKDLAGSAEAFYNIHPNRIFQSIRIGASARRYDYSFLPFDMNFNKIAPEVELVLKKKKERSSFSQSIRARYVYVLKDSYTADYLFTPPVYKRTTDTTAVADLVYMFSNSRAIDPYSIKVNLQGNSGFAKASVTMDYHFTMKKKGKGADLRVFAGTFLNNADAGLYRFRLSGWSAGRGNGSGHDYLYDYTFLGRSEARDEKFLSHQFFEEDGAMKAYTAYGQTDKWMLAFNAKTSLPFPLFRLFADVGMTDQQSALYDFGINIPIAKNIFEIYVPLAYSSEIGDEYDVNNISFGQRIRFVLNINLLNPFSFVKDFEL